jgi:hypothetical protein
LMSSRYLSKSLPFLKYLLSSPLWVCIFYPFLVKMVLSDRVELFT